VSEVLLMQEKHHEAEPLLSLAVQIFIGQLGSSHPATQRAHTLLKQATNPRTSTASSFSLGMRMSGALQEASSSKLQHVDSRQPAPAAPAAAAAAADKTGSAAEMPSFGTVAAQQQQQQQQPEEQQQQQEHNVTVPVTDRTELAADDADGQAVTAGGVSSTAAEVTAAALAGTAAATASGAASPSGRSMPANVSIASKINNFAIGGAAGAGAATAATYGGYMSMDAGGSPVGSDKGPAAEVLLQPHAAAGSAAGDAAQGGSNQQLQRADSSMPSEDAAAPADPSEWELGRQFGQTAPLAATGVDDADAGQRAYTKVLHELTRRTSLGSHDGARDTLVTATSDAAAIAAAAAAESGGVVLAPAVTPEPAAPAAAPAAARGSASRDSSASAGGVLGRQTVVEDAAAELEAAAMAEEDDKLAKLHQAGVGDIDQLRQFLREHGWQLSRLSKSEDKDVTGAVRSGWQAARDALASGAYSSRSASAAAGGPGRTASGQADEMREQLGRGAAGGRGDGPAVQRRPPARHYSFLGPGQQPGGTGGSLGLEAVQELSSNTLQQLAMTSAELRALQAVQASALAQAAMMGGGRMPHSMPGLEQQQQLRAAQQYMQHSLPEMPWGAGWPGQDGTIEEEEEAAAAAAEDMMYQQMAHAESDSAIARLRAEQGWMNSQQQYQQQAWQFLPGRSAHTVSNGELSGQVRQQQQLFGPEGALSENDIMMTLRQQQQQQQQLYNRQQQANAAPQQRGGRRRRDSWVASYGPTHPMAAAAAAAAAACEYDVSGAEDEADLRAHFEMLQQQTLQAQQQAGGWHQQQQQEYMMAQGHPDALQASYSAALPGGGAAAAAVLASGRAQSAQLPASLQAQQLQQRGSSSMQQQYSQLSPASSLQAELPARQAAAAAAAAAAGGMPGTLFKHPSNISSYSAGSTRSLPMGQPEHAVAADAAPAEQQQQQQAAQAHEAYEQQQQQQQNMAVKARSALSMARQGSTGAVPAASDAAATAAAGAGGSASAGPSARSESTLSPPAGFSAPSSARSGHHRPAKRNVSFKLNKHQLHAAMQHQQMEEGDVGDSLELGSGSPRSIAAAAAMFGAARQGGGGAAGLQQQRVPSARSVGSRPRSPLVHSMDEQAAQAMVGHAAFSQQSPHAAFASQPLLPDSIEADNLEAYYSAAEMRVSPGPGMTGFGMPASMSRPHTAGAGGMSGMQQQQQRGAPLAPLRGPPSSGRNRSFNNGMQQQGVAAGNSWDGGDPARTHQQLLLQQQVLQVQAARLELQKQQLEIEQLLNQQQQEQQAANSGQWPPMSMAPSLGTPISPAASMPMPPQQQQCTPSQQYYQQGFGRGAAAYPNMAGYPLQPATSSASTMSVNSPTSMQQQQQQMQMQMPRGGVLEQVLDSTTPAAGGAASGQQQQQTGYGLPQIMTGPSPQSSMHTGSSFVPSSPSASSSLSSRPALSRGASDNQEAQVAAAMAAQMGAGRAAQQQQQQLRPGSPGVGKRGSGTGGGLVSGPGSSSGGRQQQQQQGQLHRLHSQRSYEEGEMVAGAGTPSHLAASAGMPPNQQHMGWPGAQGQQHALQQQLAMQQLAIQQQQQQMPGRMAGRQMYPPAAAAAAGPGIGWRQPGGAAAASASGPLGGIRTQQQGSGYMGQPAVGYSGPLGRPMHPGMAAAAAAGTPNGPAMRGHPGFAAASGPLSRMELHQLQQQQQMAHPSFPGHHPAAAASWQQQQQQQLQHVYYAAAQGMDAYQLQQLQQQLQQQQQMLQQQHEQPPPGSEDYDMWAAPPDYGGANSNMATSSGVSSSNAPHDSRGPSFTRSFIAPGGGQYWEGRRSNSFSNLEGVEAHAAAAGSAGSLGKAGIARSRSSSELAHEGEQRQE
jgi:hypothetical protein